MIKLASDDPCPDEHCDPCPLGTYCFEGILTNCPRNTYGDVPLASDEGACRPCPLHSNSPERSASVDDCLCDIKYMVRKRAQNCQASSSCPCIPTALLPCPPAALLPCRPAALPPFRPVLPCHHSCLPHTLTQFLFNDDSVSAVGQFYERV